MERPANLDGTSGIRSTDLVRGTIRKLTRLSAGSDIQSVRLVAAHNGAGYGYIGTLEGDVYFDASAVANLRFDQLKPNMTVEYALDQAAYLRTSRITVVADGPGDKQH